MCFISGQLSVSVEGQYIEGTIEEEANRAFENVFSAARTAEFSKDDILYMDIAFSDLTQVKIVNEIYMRLLPEGKRPARTIAKAAALPFGGKITIVETAVKDNA